MNTRMTIASTCTDPNSQKIVYVGRGASPGRAVQHTDGSHNPGLRAIIDEGNYSVELAGPYSFGGGRCRRRGGADLGLTDSDDAGGAD